MNYTCSGIVETKDLELITYYSNPVVEDETTSNRDTAFNKNLVEPYGDHIIAGNGIYDYCRRCGSLVKLNKFLFGSLHICK